MIVSLALTGCFPEQIAAAKPGKKTKEVKAEAPKLKEGFELATFGAGCFWCIEAVLEQLEGVDDVVSGYMGGKTKNPTYDLWSIAGASSDSPDFTDESTWITNWGS